MTLPREVLARSIAEMDSADFWSNVDTQGDCWLWRGRLMGGNPVYVSMTKSRRTLMPGRVIWFLCRTDDLPSSITRTCGMRLCVNPDHLAPRVPPREKAPCKVDGCDRLSVAHAMCAVHYSRWYAYGDPLHKPRIGGRKRTAPANYEQVHYRLRKERGVARLLTCVECGGPADEWSYDHGDPGEQVSESGPWSPNISAYSPRCVACHRAYDAQPQEDHILRKPWRRWTAHHQQHDAPGGRAGMEG